MSLLEYTEFNAWIDDTKYCCPAQCYYYFKVGENYYCIYLRWRWEDPWSASLVKFKDKTLYWEDSLWISLEVNDYKLDELDELKTEVRKKVISMLNRL